MIVSATLSLVLSLLSFCHAQNSSHLPLQQVLSSTKNVSSFNDLLTNSYPDILSVLSAQQESQQPITIIVPSDEAFGRIPNSVLGPAFSNNDTAAIRSILQYHILPGSHGSDTFTSSFQFLPTWLTDTTYTNVSGGQRVGVVVQNKQDIVFTSGGGTRSNVEQADIAFTGGILHVVNMPVIPPQSFLATAEQFNLTAFVGAIYENASLVQIINDARDVTMFTPNNDAFQEVGSALKSLSNDSLSTLLEYHIVLGSGGPEYTTLLTNGTVLRTSGGGNATVRDASNSLFVNNAKLLQSDVLIANGVIHILDNILDPNVTNATPNPMVATQVPVLAGSSVPRVPFTELVPPSTSSVFTSTSTESSTSLDSFGSTASSSPTSSPGNAQSTKKSEAARDLGRVCQKLLLPVLIMLYSGAICAACL